MGSNEGGFSNVKSVKDKAAMVENKGKVSTIEGATEARRRDQTNLLPHPKEIVGEAIYKQHLKLFEAGAARFEAPFIAQMSKDVWGFGQDFKFLTTKGEADKAQQDSQKPDPKGDTGIWHMEKEFGAPKGRWVDIPLGGGWANPKHQMIRYDFPHPEKFDLDMAKGTEKDAFKEEWVAGGQTLGGMNEAVIKKIDKVKFLEELANTANPLIKETPIDFPTTPNFKLDGTTLTPNAPDSPS
jgi:hypothetical protein